MNSTNNLLIEKDKTTADALVDGLVAGIIAGVVMGVFLLLGGWFFGDKPARILIRFIPGDSGSPVAGAFLHVAVSGIYGMIFAYMVYIARKLVNARSAIWIAGLAYGFLIWVIAQWVILPETGSALQAFPSWLFALSHLVFGCILGWWIGYRS